MPTFWSEVENYACNTLSKLSETKYVNDVLKISQNSTSETQLSMLYVEYSLLRQTIIEKYGMSHLVDSIIRYMNSSGKAIWIQDSERFKKKVFLRPSLLFDMFYSLFRTEFKENFTENHMQTLRAKLVKNSINMNADNVEKMITNLIEKGE